MADIFGRFSYIRFAGCLELRGVPPITRGTPICIGYLIIWGNSICVGNL